LYLVARQTEGPAVRPKEAVLKIDKLEKTQVDQVSCTKPQGTLPETLLIPSGGLQDRINVHGRAGPCLRAQRLKAGLRLFRELGVPLVDSVAQDLL
jgi:hypothetical protein